MEQVNSKNGMITKAVRTKVNFVKAQKDNLVLKNSEDLIKLAEEAKPIKDAVKNAKGVADADAKWDTLMDAFIKTTKNLKEVAAKDGVTFEEAKEAHGAVKKSCTDCHTIFRVEDE